jgi:hypothetical protein
MQNGSGLGWKSGGFKKTVGMVLGESEIGIEQALEHS